jgi:DNA polymerase-3 subunit alpha
MPESNHKKFNHLKIHTQYSICEGAIKIDELKDNAKELKISALGMCDTSNLCGAVEFSDKLSKVGTQPIIGTQINFKFNDTVGLLPLFALDIEGYKKIIELSSRSYLENGDLSDPHLDINDLLRLDTNGISVFSGTIFGLFGKLFDKAKFDEIINFYKKLNAVLGDRFYLEIQRHEDHNESEFEKFNLDQSKKLEIPIIATNEVFYLTKDMHEAHDALICIGNKTYVNDKNRIKYSPNHYLKNDSEMSDLFSDLPEALENNYNFPYRSSFRPLFSKPILPNISSSDEGNASDIIRKEFLGRSQRKI